MADIFLSYARDDQDRAHRLAEALEASGFTVWWDRTIPPGKTFEEVIEGALHDARCVIVLWSRKSIASSWVRNEAVEGSRRGILLPVLIEPVTPPLGLRHLEHADLTGETDVSNAAELRLLIESARAIVQGPGVSWTREPGVRDPRAHPGRPRRPVLRWVVAGVFVALLGVAGYLVAQGRGRNRGREQESTVESQLKSDLIRLMTAMQAHYLGSDSFPRGFSDLPDFVPSGDVTMLLRSWSRGWEGVAESSRLPGVRCGIFVGSAAPPFSDVTLEGVPACGPGILADLSLAREADRIVGDEGYLQRTQLMKQDLARFVSAEESYFADSVRYTTDFTQLRFVPSESVTVVITSASGTGNAAAATHRGLPGVSCGVYVGSGTSPVSGAREGIAMCTKH